MPLPLIPIVLGIFGGVTTGVGVYKGAKGVMDSNKANKVNDNAKDIIDDAQTGLKAARDNTSGALEELGREKIGICDTHIAHFLDSFGKLKNVELEKSLGLQELAKFRIDKASFEDLKDVSLKASSLIAGTAGGVTAGAAVAFGAYGLAGTFATASTGTAIGVLHGVAATNATLAFFGGGALAAGGLGMTAGTAVLGGLVAGPALAVIGIVVGASASKKLDDAYANLATARKVEAELKVLVSACEGIRKRAGLFTRTLIKLKSILNRQLAQLEYIISTEGVDYSVYSESSKNTVAMILGTVQAVKALLDTPILNEDGSLTSESETVVNAVRGALNA